MVRSPCCDKQGLKKGPWTPEEDMKLIQYIHTHGAGNWRLLPKNAGLERCGKSCRLRWTNYLRPDIKRGRFSFEEEETIIQLHSVLGNKWSGIAARLPGRTDNEIKNYWNTHIRKRLLRMGIDPVTHAPRLDLSSLLLRLINPQELSLALSLLSSNAHQNPNLLLDLLPPFQPNHFENINNVVHPSNLTHHSSLPITQPQSTQNNLPMNSPTSTAQPLQHYVPSNESFPPNLSDSFYGVSADLSETNSSCFDSVLSTPTASTFIDGTTQDEKEISFCSDLLRFEIPESLELDYFM